MSYVETPPSYRFPWYVRLLLWLQRRRYGRALEPVRLWGRIPGALIAVLAMNRVVDRRNSRVEPELRSLIQVRVSQINWCAFCVDLNSHLGRERGIPEEKLAALADFVESPAFSEREKAALRYAEAVTRGDAHVDARIVSRLRENFDDDAIVELAALIAFQNLSSKFNAALGIPAHGFGSPNGAKR